MSVLYLSLKQKQHLAQGKRQATTLPSVNRERLMLDASFSMSLLVLVSFTRSLPACTDLKQSLPPIRSAPNEIVSPQGQTRTYSWVLLSKTPLRQQALRPTRSTKLILPEDASEA